MVGAVLVVVGRSSFVAGRGSFAVRLSLLPSPVGNNSEGPVHPKRLATNDQRWFEHYWFVASSSIVSRNRKTRRSDVGFASGVCFRNGCHRSLHFVFQRPVFP